MDDCLQERNNMVTKKDLCILHIGTEKTASTTIQENFYSGVKDKRVLYPDLGSVNHNIQLFGLFLRKIRNLYFFQENDFSINEVEIYRKNIKKKLELNFLDSSKSIIILSAESLAVSTKEEIIDMKHYLSKFFNKILIICYVRPAQSFSSSAFQQRVKYHKLSKFDYSLIFRYKHLDNYIDVYGDENVKIIPFIPRLFPDGDILQDFCLQTGIEIQKSRIKKSNESLSKEAISILFTYNYHKNVKTDFGKKNAIIQNELVERIRVIGNEKFQFSGELIQNWVKNYFEDDYTWLLNRINPQDRKYFELDSLQKGVSTEIELMEYATNSIEQLASLVKPNLIDFELSKHPQTVAKLVNKLRIQIASEL